MHMAGWHAGVAATSSGSAMRPYDYVRDKAGGAAARLLLTSDTEDGFRETSRRAPASSAPTPTGLSAAARSRPASRLAFYSCLVLRSRVLFHRMSSASTR
jgi:hypothetical protein